MLVVGEGAAQFALQLPGTLLEEGQHGDNTETPGERRTHKLVGRKSAGLHPGHKKLLLAQPALVARQFIYGFVSDRGGSRRTGNPVTTHIIIVFAVLKCLAVEALVGFCVVIRVPTGSEDGWTRAVQDYLQEPHV